MFRNTAFFNPSKKGKTKYAGSKHRGGAFQELQIAAFNYQFNRGKANEEHLKWMKESKYKLYD